MIFYSPELDELVYRQPGFGWFFADDIVEFLVPDSIDWIFVGYL